MKTAVVTGGSSGIGRAAALLLKKNGYNVYDFSRSGTDMDGIHHITVDVTDEQSVIAAFNEVAKTNISVDILINNAGFGISGSVENTKLCDAKAQFDVNFFGCFVCSKAAIPYLRKSAGRIVNISSVAAVFSIPFQSFYSASKAAINSLTLSLANELRPFGIKVSCVMPGDVKTGFTQARKKSSDGAKLYTHMENAIKSMEHDEETGLSPEKIAKKVIAVLNKRNPAPIYTAGNKYKFFLALGRILPYRFQNYIVGKLYS